jgi:uncharacterized protein
MNALTLALSQSGEGTRKTLSVVPRNPLNSPTMSSRKTVVGMVHLKPLPGSPGFDGDYAAIREAAVRDADALSAGGVDAIMLENFGDIPFFKGAVPQHTVAFMTALAADVVKRVSVPVGINVLRNDGCAALSIAAATGAKMIRVNVLTAARVTDQGVIEGISADLLRLKALLGAKDVQIYADIDVKHSAPLAPRPIEEEVADTVERGGADVLIVSGSGTGKPTDPGMAQRVKRAEPTIPVFIGSGITIDTIAAFGDDADGFIVGTHFKEAGRVELPVDVKRVKAFVARVR